MLRLFMEGFPYYTSHAVEGLFSTKFTLSYKSWNLTFAKKKLSVSISLGCLQDKKQKWWFSLRDPSTSREQSWSLFTVQYFSGKKKLQLLVKQTGFSTHGPTECAGFSSPLPWRGWRSWLESTHLTIARFSKCWRLEHELFRFHIFVPDRNGDTQKMDAFSHGSSFHFNRFFQDFSIKNLIPQKTAPALARTLQCSGQGVLQFLEDLHVELAGDDPRLESCRWNHKKCWITYAYHHQNPPKTII